MSKIRVATSAIAALALLPAAAAQAECLAPLINPGGNFCDGRRYEASMSTSRDQVCERPYTSAPMARFPLVVLGHRLVQRAKHGVGGVRGVTMAYAPGKGYIGKDEFTVEVDFRQGSLTGKYYVHWNVTVN